MSGLDFAPCILQGHEPVFVQALLPLNDSTVALSVGVPGRKKSIWLPHSYTHLSGIFPANLEPLSVFSRRGKGV